MALRRAVVLVQVISLRFGHFTLFEFMILGHSVKVIVPLIVESGTRVAILIVGMGSLFSNVALSLWNLFSYVLWCL